MAHAAQQHAPAAAPKLLFKDFEEFKARAEFFPKGRIVPQRVMKLVRRGKHRSPKNCHLVKFGADVWMVRILDRQVLIGAPESGYLVEISHLKGNWILKGNPYRSEPNYLLGWNNGQDPIAYLNRRIKEWQT